jgi:hypothetical protein
VLTCKIPLHHRKLFIDRELFPNHLAQVFVVSSDRVRLDAFDAVHWNSNNTCYIRTFCPQYKDDLQGATLHNNMIKAKDRPPNQQSSAATEINSKTIHEPQTTPAQSWRAVRHALPALFNTARLFYR